jgi:hypothetical protein
MRWEPLEYIIDEMGTDIYMSALYILYVYILTLVFHAFTTYLTPALVP